MSKLDSNKYIKVKIDMDELDVTVSAARLSC